MPRLQIRPSDAITCLLNFYTSQTSRKMSISYPATPWDKTMHLEMRAASRPAPALGSS